MQIFDIQFHLTFPEFLVHNLGTIMTKVHFDFKRQIHEMFEYVVIDIGLRGEFVVEWVSLHLLSVEGDAGVLLDHFGLGLAGTGVLVLVLAEVTGCSEEEGSCSIYSHLF